MTSSTINNLCPFVQRRDLFPDVNDGVGRLIFFSRYGSSDLALPDRVRRIVLAISVPAATSSTIVIGTLGSGRLRPACLVFCPWNIGVGALADVG